MREEKGKEGEREGEGIREGGEGWEKRRERGREDRAGEGDREGMIERRPGE